MIDSTEENFMSTQTEPNGSYAMDWDSGVVGDNDILIPMEDVLVVYEPFTLGEKISTCSRIST
jgi:hypothetical protein